MADPQNSIDRSNKSRSDDTKRRNGYRVPITLVHRKTKTIKRFKRNTKFAAQDQASGDPDPDQYMLDSENKANTPASQQKYQIFYRGKPIDEDTRDGVFAQHIDWFYECQIHKHCHAGTGRSKVLKTVKLHLSKYLFRHRCVLCRKRAGEYTNMFAHLNTHPKAG